MTLAAPRTRMWLPPNSSFNLAFTRSLMVRSLYLSCCAQMKLVAAPVLILPLVVLLGAHVALPGQIAQHLFQLLMPLPLDARTAPGSFGFAKRAWSTFGLRLPARSLLLFSRLGETLARRDRGRIARNMTDQALALGSGNDRLMQLLGQFGGGEFGEGAGEFGL